MNSITLDLPSALRDAIAGEASRRGVSEAEWLEEAVRDKLKAESQLAYIANRAARANRAEYDRLLSRAPSTLPMPGDELP